MVETGGRSSNITSESSTRDETFWDEPALSAFSDGYVAAFGDSSLTAYTNPNYESGDRTNNLTADTGTWTSALS